MESITKDQDQVLLVLLLLNDDFITIIIYHYQCMFICICISCYILPVIYFLLHASLLLFIITFLICFLYSSHHIYIDVFMLRLFWLISFSYIRRIVVVIINFLYILNILFFFVFCFCLCFLMLVLYCLLLFLQIHDDYICQDYDFSIYFFHDCFVCVICFIIIVITILLLQVDIAVFLLHFALPECYLCLFVY